MHAPVSNWVCGHPRECVLTFGAIIERWPFGRLEFASMRDADKIQA
jgi:hypothetical protein